MNAILERSRSLWMGVPLPHFAPLTNDATADVVVIGAGIAGLSTAYELARHGLSVVVLERGVVGGGMTLRTSGHLTSEIDDLYFKLIKRRGAEAARTYFESQSRAIDRIESIVSEEGIECDFARIPGFLWAAGSNGQEILKNELSAARQIGFPGAHLTTFPGRRSKALCFPGQARFHPAKYLNGLCVALQRQGVRIFENSAVSRAQESEVDVETELENGPRVRSSSAVFATNTPVNDLVALHTKQAPYRTYVIAAEVPPNTVADVLAWDTRDPYHYVRIQPEGDRTYLIAGGEDHKSGTEDDGTARVERLFKWAKRRFPTIGNMTHAWSGQVYEPVDYVPYLGLNPGDRRTYIISGDSGEGLTSGVVGAMLIADLIMKGVSPWSELYDPWRITVGAVGTFIAENKTMIGSLAEHITRGELGSADELTPGQGALIVTNGKKAAVYRDQAGALHTVSASCSHLGCIVHFNSFETCWDCPCHGSQFSVDGDVLAGPARSPLKKVG